MERCKRHHRLDCDICFPKTEHVQPNESVPSEGEGQSPEEIEFTFSDAGDDDSLIEIDPADVE